MDQPKRLALKLFYYSGIGRLMALGNKQPACTVLAYHRVCPYEDQDPLLSGLFTDPKLFEQQIRYIKQHYTVLPIESLVDCLRAGRTIPKNSIVITFDDGYEDNYRFAFPVLKKYEVPASIFVPTAYIETGRGFWWDHLSFLLSHTRAASVSFEYAHQRFDFDLGNLKKKSAFFDRISNIFKLCCSPREEEELLNTIAQHLDVPKPFAPPAMLNWEQLKEMQDNHISVGAHTHNHRAISCLTDTNTHQELYLSRQILERQLQNKVTVIAYPYGEEPHVGQKFLMVGEAGYQAGLTTISGLTTKGQNLYLLPRTCIGDNESMEVFQLKITGVLNRLLKVRGLCRLK